MTVTVLYRRVTANNVKRFLAGPIADMLFPNWAIQVGGGVDVMASFEKACKV